MAKIEMRIPDWVDRICVWPVMVYRKRKYGYTFRRIYLDDGFWTILDQQDYYRFNSFKWCISGNGHKFYAARFVKKGPGKTKTIYLHREIMKPPAGLLVDHRNTNTLDNRRTNLRPATHSQNTCNRLKSKRKNVSSQFVGVYLDKRTGRWISQIAYRRKKLHLGVFDTEMAAARAHDEAAAGVLDRITELVAARAVSAAEGPREPLHA